MPLSAQVVTARQYENKGDAAFAVKDYNTALSHYMIILIDEPKRTDLYWKTAEAARLSRRYSVASKYYTAFAGSEAASRQPLLNYRLGIMQKSLGKYADAIELFNKYIAANPNGESVAAAKTDLEASEWALKQITEGKLYEVKHLDDKVNTAYIDAAPVQHGNILYFTSSYQATINSKPVAHVFATNLQEKAQPLSINAGDDNVNTAHYAITPKGNRLFYTLSIANESGDLIGQIYSRYKAADGTWGKAFILDSTINAKGYITTQPAVGFDKSRNKEVLYFVSDRSGGKGGLDIWYADIEANGKMGMPQNLSAINTVKDDMTPFFMDEQQLLMFSTEGYQSFGGFDIYKAQKEGANWGIPQNAGYPTNSSFDDMYPSFSPEAGRYYFVSNRLGGMCESREKDCSCDDIYSQDIKANLDASVFFATSKEPMNGCRFDLIDADTKKVVLFDVAAPTNNVNYALELNRNYMIVASKNGFISDSVSFDTKGFYEPSTTVYEKLYLRSNIKLQVLVFDKVSRKALNGSTVSIYTLDGKLVKREILTTGNELLWKELTFNTTYRIVAEKTTYDKDEKTIITEGYAKVDMKTDYVVELYLSPFSGLPVTLYFHNDEPDPSSRESTTSKTYGDAFTSYYNLLIEYLAACDKESGKENSIDTVQNFFQYRIKYGYDKLVEFSPQLLNYLSNGYGMEIVLQGFASPLADNQYNRVLTSRRVSSVINHFYKYSGGLFTNYIKKGQLRIRVEPFGEDHASYGASDNPSDRKRSIYSVRAMAERKVEVQEIGRFEYNPLEQYDLNSSMGMYFDTDASGTVSGIAKNTYTDSRMRVVKGRKGKGKGNNQATYSPVQTYEGGYNSQISFSSPVQTYDNNSQSYDNNSQIYTLNADGTKTYVNSSNLGIKGVKKGKKNRKNGQYMQNGQVISGEFTPSDVTVKEQFDLGVRYDPTVKESRVASQSNSSKAYGTIVYPNGKSMELPNYNDNLMKDYQSESVTSANGGFVGVKYNNMPTDNQAAFVPQMTAKQGAKQRYQVVFIDSYTGAVIDNMATVELYGENSDKVVGQATRRQGTLGYTYDVDFNKDYLIKGNIDGYGASSKRHFATYTEGGANIVTDTLFLSPFGDMPASLYFDNNYPLKEDNNDKTSVTYEQTYREFMSKKTEFIKVYNKMTGAAGTSIVQQNDMNLFFDAEVTGGYKRLVGFSGIMKNYLQRGYKLEVVIEGYASPLADDIYNQKLATRRTQAIINHFETFGGGILRKYIKNGQLTIKVDPLGEISHYVTDDIKNAASIYSIEASRERRVIIKDIIIRK